MTPSGDDPMAGSAAARAIAELDAASLATFGYVDDYPPYRIAYPWLLAQLARLPAGAHVLDLGAGVSAVPIVLARRGLRVDCVDSSPIDHVLPAGDDWNGWGFFDYSTVHPRLRAFRSEAQSFAGEGPYAAVASFGMLAHLTAADRRALLARCREWLAPGGELLAYVDLHPGGDWLWNRCQDREVEPLEVHGSVADVAAELHAAGFVDVGLELFRAIDGARTDVLLARAVAPLRAR
jgi:cyclopropane fatty-acyl-phospholipid synthase-like methyltransferase